MLYEENRINVPKEMYVTQIAQQQQHPPFGPLPFHYGFDVVKRKEAGRDKKVEKELPMERGKA